MITAIWVLFRYCLSVLVPNNSHVCKHCVVDSALSADFTPNVNIAVYCFRIYYYTFIFYLVILYTMIYVMGYLPTFPVAIKEVFRGDLTKGNKNRFFETKNRGFVLL